MNWIDIKYELPKEDFDYIVSDGECAWEAGYSCKNNIWHDWEAITYRNVTHWMPLPEPPKI